MAHSVPHDSPEVLALIVRGSSMVTRIAKRIRRGLDSSYQLDDLAAAGHIGLIEAARRFDANYGVKFEAFAYQRIQGEIYFEVGRFSTLKGGAYHRAVALEAAAVANGNDACEAALQLAALQNRGEMTAAQIEQALDALIGSVVTATAIGLLRPAVETDTVGESDFEVEYHQRELTALVLRLLDEVDPEDAAIFKRKHFEDLTFQDCATEFGISRPWVFRRYSRVLDFLQKRLRRMDAS